MTRIDKQAYWHQHIKAWESGQQSQPDYCEANGLKLGTFSYWRTRCLRQRLAAEAESIDSGRFVAVKASSFAPASRSDDVHTAQAVIEYGSVRLTLPPNHLPHALPLLQGLARSGL